MMTLYLGLQDNTTITVHLHTGSYYDAYRYCDTFMHRSGWTFKTVKHNMLQC